MQEWPKFIFHLSQDFVKLRFAELNSIAELIGAPNCIKNAIYIDDSALFTCEIPNKEISQKIASRSVFLKSVSELYFQGESLKDLLAWLNSNDFPCKIELDETVKIDFYAFGKSYEEKEKLEMIDKIGQAIDFDKRIRVCLDNKRVSHRFVYFEDWIHIRSKTELEESFENSKQANDEDCSIKKEETARKYLRSIYFGRYMKEGQCCIVPKFNLKDRQFISNTTMDPCLSLVMSNMGHANKGKLVFDPFVGSGSLLVGAAHYGSHVMGADLDYKLVHGFGLSSRQGQKYRSKNENIRNNLKQYGLEDYFLDILVADFSTPYIKCGYKFDAIITDPPYGIREKAKKVGPKKKPSENTELNEARLDKDPEDSTSSIPQKIQYLLSEIYSDLLEFAIEHLEDNGRLVYWVPVYLERDRSIMTEQEITSTLRDFVPLKKGLKLIEFSEQRLTRFTSRILVTMARITDKSSGTNYGDEITKDLTINSLNRFRENYFSSNKN